MASQHAVIIPTCRHLLPNGVFCLGAAVKTRKYCRHHLKSRLHPRNMARARRRLPLVEMPPLLLDARAIELGVTRVRVAAEDRRLDPDTARVMLWALRMSADIVRKLELGRQSKSNALYHIPLSARIQSFTHKTSRNPLKIQG